MKNLAYIKQNKLRQTNNQLFERDALSLFTYRKQGHMGAWEYGPSLYPGDPAGGSELWANLVAAPGDYYPAYEEIKSIHKAIKNPKFIDTISSINNVVELGPGSPGAIFNKTLPVISVCNKIDKFIAIDAAVEQADEAASIIEQICHIETTSLEANYISSKFTKEWQGKSAFVMWGITIGNMNGFKKENPNIKLVSILRNLRKNLSKDDLFIFSFDTEKNAEKIKKSYREMSLKESNLSTLHRLKREKIVTGNFEPKSWFNEPVWYPETRQCAHTVFPICDQELEIAGKTIKIPAWTRFISNNSYKFSTETIENAADKAGISPLFCLQDGPIALFVGSAK